MFKQRLLTTLVLVPLVLLAIYYGSPLLLGSLVVLVVVVLGWEWLPLIPVNRLIYKGVFIGVLLALVWFSMPWAPIGMILVFALWMCILVAVLTFPRSEAVWGHRIIVGAACLVLLPVLASTINALYHLDHGRDLLVYLLCLIWGTDIGAYLAGKQWGRHKLIPSVSPGKTYEGALGGLVLAMTVACVAFVYFSPPHAMLWFAEALLTILMSMLGDLFISMLKRRSHVKDTGHIFPGHGGVLDRLDSLIAAAPFFYCGLHFCL